MFGLQLILGLHCITELYLMSMFNVTQNARVTHAREMHFLQDICLVLAREIILHSSLFSQHERSSYISLSLVDMGSPSSLVGLGFFSGMARFEARAEIRTRYVFRVRVRIRIRVRVRVGVRVRVKVRIRANIQS